MFYELASFKFHNEAKDWLAEMTREGWQVESMISNNDRVWILMKKAP